MLARNALIVNDNIIVSPSPYAGVSSTDDKVICIRQVRSGDQDCEHSLLGWISSFGRKDSVITPPLRQG